MEFQLSYYHKRKIYNKTQEDFIFFDLKKFETTKFSVNSLQGSEFCIKGMKRITFENEITRCICLFTE